MHKMTDSTCYETIVGSKILKKGVNSFIDELKRYIDYYNNERISMKLKGMSPVQYRTHSRANEYLILSKLWGSLQFRSLFFYRFLLRYNNFLLRLNPFNACTEFLGDKAYRSVSAVILNKRSRIKLNFLAIYICNV